MEMEMRSQQFGHNHSMVFNQVLSNQTKEASCLRCGETLSGSSFCCAECGLYLHKRCAEAASQIDHPFHRKHPLVLLPQPPGKGRCICNFCSKTCEKFVYHCPCNLDLHIKCALLSLSIAEKKLGVLEHVAIKVPLLSTTDDSKELEGAKCFVCWEPLLGSMHFSLDCGFNLHKKCVELPHEIKWPFHKKRPLILQFDFKPSSCQICQHRSPGRGFVYSCSPSKITLHIECAKLSPTINLLCHRKHPLILDRKEENLSCKACKKAHNNHFMYACSPCRFSLHIECALPPQTMKGKSHTHPFTLFWRPASFICDACGLKGQSLSYICSPCNLSVHKACIFLPPMIEIPRHEHPISHKYFLPQHIFMICDCGLCGSEVNIEYGSYSCFICKFIVHVKCALEKTDWFRVIEGEGRLGILPLSRSSNLINLVTQKAKGGEMADHISSHVHDLELWQNPMEEFCEGGNLMEKYCDGCVLPISSPFYYCSGCNFLLHQTCAELPQEKKLWFHKCQKLLILVEGPVFKCDFCHDESNGFSYRCDPCDVHYCLPCAASGYKIVHQAHEHPLLFHRKHEGRCSGCNVSRRGLFKCMSCPNFNLHIRCSRLPLTALHRCDEHLLALTYEEASEYSEYHYCDICEKERDPRQWFYHCATCDVSAHPGCALGGYPFIKPGSIYKGLEDHPHSLTFVKKIFSGPACHSCGKPCRDLTLECTDSACNYIVDWSCAKPAPLRRRGPAGFKSESDKTVRRPTRVRDTGKNIGIIRGRGRGRGRGRDSDSDRDRRGALCVVL